MYYYALDVPDRFWKNKSFQCDATDLREFLTPMFGWIEGGEFNLAEGISIEGTIKHHTGDCRLWYKEGGYGDFFADIVIMRSDEVGYYVDIFDWMLHNASGLYQKHMNNE